MTKITQAQLIKSLSQLEEIKPRKEWAVLLRSQILSEKQTMPVQAQSVGFIDTLKFIFAPRKLVYAFSVILFLIIGVLGFENLPQKQIASLTSQETKNQTTIALKNQINTTIKSLAQNLKNNPVQDPQAMKILAKTLADMPGDVADNQDVQDLMQTVVKSEIADLQKTTLTDAQKDTLAKAQKLYDQGKYADALELLMVSN